MNMCKGFVELFHIGLIDTLTVCHFSAVAIDDYELDNIYRIRIIIIWSQR